MKNQEPQAEPPLEPTEAAEAAGLVYVSDEEPGFKRQRKGKGFAYLHPRGDYVRDPQLRQRLEGLVIPPAWEQVWICPDPKGHIQATGRDAKGRKQYIYHPQWHNLRNRSKYHRLAAFAEALPAIREASDAHLGLRNLSRQKVLAIVVQLLQSTHIRVGNPEYARLNRSFGLTTLQDQHIKVDGATISFMFNGKSGKETETDLHDRRLARMVQRCQELPGQQLFQYIDEDGQLVHVSSQNVNSYLQEISGQSFTAKDFRTWAGTVHAAMALHAIGPGNSDTDKQRRVVQAVRQVAKALNNTPAVCRKYYIHPRILSAYFEDSLSVHMEKYLGKEADPNGLASEEAAVLSLLKEG